MKVAVVLGLLLVGCSGNVKRSQPSPVGSWKSDPPPSSGADFDLHLRITPRSMEITSFCSSGDVVLKPTTESEVRIEADKIWIGQTASETEKISLAKNVKVECTASLKSGLTPYVVRGDTLILGDGPNAKTFVRVNQPQNVR